jgi:hypothetical protein
MMNSQLYHIGLTTWNAAGGTKSRLRKETIPTMPPKLLTYQPAELKYTLGELGQCNGVPSISKSKFFVPQMKASSHFIITPPLPKGLRFNTKTGEISGNPREASSTTHSIMFNQPQFYYPQASTASVKVVIEPVPVLLGYEPSEVNYVLCKTCPQGSFTASKPLLNQAFGPAEDKERFFTIDPPLPLGCHLDMDSGALTIEARVQEQFPQTYTVTFNHPKYTLDTSVSTAEFTIAINGINVWLMELFGYTPKEKVKRGSSFKLPSPKKGSFRLPSPGSFRLSPKGSSRGLDTSPKGTSRSLLASVAGALQTSPKARDRSLSPPRNSIRSPRSGIANAWATLPSPRNSFKNLRGLMSSADAAEKTIQRQALRQYAEAFVQMGMRSPHDVVKYLLEARRKGRDTYTVLSGLLRQIQQRAGISNAKHLKALEEAFKKILGEGDREVFVMNIEHSVGWTNSRWRTTIEKMQESVADGETLVFHYTSLKNARLVLQKDSPGLRCRPEGGVYFSTSSPHDYGMGKFTRTQFTRSAITDCYGANRIKDGWAWANFEAVLICSMSAEMLVPVPGGSKTALMVEQQMLEEMYGKNTDGSFYLDLDVIKHAYQLDDEGTARGKAESHIDAGGRQRRGSQGEFLDGLSLTLPK